ncbi:MAG: ATP-binding protein [Deltaproteobacteria bacterium]|nr:ATP-binding protein [Deltaproteobacteria bacterium]
MDAVINPMVEYLNSLRTQQQSSNSTYIYEARKDFLQSLQRRAPWFPGEERLYIRTRLDSLVEDLASGRLRTRIVLLTGDAGDGKTALCAALARRLGFASDLQPETIVRSWRIIKDASEIEEDVLAQRVEAQLQGASNEVLIVAINEGRLRRLFHRVSGRVQKVWLEVVQPALEGWLDKSRAETLNAAMEREQVLVVNFRHRFHLRAVTPSLLESWTPRLLWEDGLACGDCPARVRCPIVANVEDLRSQNVRSRIADVLAYSHFSGQRLPFRRLQAVLALATTGGLSCTDVQSSSTEDASSVTLLRHRYYNTLFLRDELRAPVLVRPEPIARSFAGTDPGGFVIPDLDRRIGDLFGPQREQPRWNGDEPLPRMEAEAVGSLRQRLLPGQLGADIQEVQIDLSRLTRSIRRWAMFVSNVSSEMTWCRALELVEGYAEGRDRSSDALKAIVVEAINHLHRVEGIKTTNITENQIDAAGFRTPARQVLELNLGIEFSATLRCGPQLPRIVQEYLEGSPSEIYLAAASIDHPENPVLLALDARLVEIFLSVSSGFVAWQGLGTYRRALSRFHAQLLVLSQRAGHEPRVTIRSGDKHYGVSVDTTGTSPQLRMEAEG